ncbi:MAG: filamentous hemagglutinin N-terminal domain-containing protein, partial [Desulfurivibrio sp.]
MMNRRVRAFAKRLTGRKAAGKGLPATRLPRRDERAVTPLSVCLGASICLSALAAPPSLLALPQNGRVAAGSASMVYSPSRLEINQATDKAVIDWRSFNIATGEHTRFNQPSASAIALNRVSGGDPSSILGTLTANGRVMLVNPNGIFFGPGSRVDAGGLVATTADIANEDFLAGNLRFAIPSPVPNASVINQGTITVHEAGLAALVAPTVANSGVIQARLGKVALAAGNTFTLDLYGDQLVQFAVGSAVGEEQAQAAESLVSNSGLISADGGTVLLTASAAGRALSQVVNMDGIIEARAVEVGQGGEIILHGGDSGIVSVSGTLDASGREAGQRGGSVQVLGDKVGLFAGAVIDSSGDAGGGEVLVGGDFQGATADVKNATATYVDGAATITADAASAGDGGKVIVWADGATRYAGGISARGGSVSGDGGFVEVSGEAHLDFAGTVDTRAANGSTGTLLLDPTNIVIADGTGDSAADGNTTFAGDPGGLIGAVVADDTSPSLLYESELEGIAATNNIVLEAKNNISINNLADNILNLQTGPGNSVTFTADADANGGGAFSMAAGDRIRTAGAAVSISGAGLTRVSVEASGADVSLDSSKSAVIARITSSTVQIDAADNITDSSNAIINVSGQGVLTAGGAITLGDTVADSVNFGSLAATAATSLTINENSNMLVDQLSAATASLASTGAITDSSSATINVSGLGILAAGGSLTLGDTDTDSVNFGSLDVLAATSASISENSGMLVNQLSAASAQLTSTGDISDSSSATINVSGKGIFAAGGSITLGDTGTDSVNFGRLDATAVSEIAINENSGMLVDKLSAATVSLGSSGSITDSSSAAINVSGPGILAAGGLIALGDTGTDSVNFGSLDATAVSTLAVSENSDMHLGALSGTSINLASTGSIYDADVLSEASANATGNQIILQAAGSLGAAGDGDLDINSPALTATFAGNIYVDNTADFAQLSLISTSIAANIYQISGDNLTFSVTDNGLAYLLTEVSDTSGLNFSFQGNGDIEIGALDVGVGTVTLSGNAINDVPGEVDTDITASAVELNALAGIGNNAAIALATQGIQADSTNGAIAIHNSSAATITVHSLTTGTGAISFAQSGGGGLLAETITTTNGGIAVSVAGAHLDNSGGAITAGGAADMALTTTGSGSITLGSLQ